MENFILKNNFFNRAIIRLPEKDISASLYNGSNQKKILIVSILQDSYQTFDEAFLKKIFESVQVNIPQDAVLLLLPKDKAFTWETITKTFDFDQLVLFGKDLQNVGLQIASPSYVPFAFQNRQFLIADPLDLIENDRAKKGALWNALKEIFIK